MERYATHQYKAILHKNNNKKLKTQEARPEHSFLSIPLGTVVLQVLDSGTERIMFISYSSSSGPKSR